tara:strand:+ start:1109 stop:3334 length:2226 start_codon:yes stop_codon:yes gene_type:complete
MVDYNFLYQLMCIEKLIKRGEIMFFSRLTLAILSFTIISPISSEEVEEIVVTALKRSSTVVETPASITALGSTEIEDRGISTMDDLKNIVPSMNFTNVLEAYNITIRGIGQFNGNPGVSVSTDGVFQSRAHSAQLGEMDLERIEVLRGPQGTLYGRNSIGGVVNFITKEPSQDYGGYIKAGYADYKIGKTEFAVGGGINETTSFRLSASLTEQGEGYVKCLNEGCPDHDAVDRKAYRLKVKSDISETVQADILIAETSTEGIPAPYGWLESLPELATAAGVPYIEAAAKTFKPHEVYQTPTSLSPNKGNFVNKDYDLASLALTIDTNFGTIKSITAKQDFYDQFNMDRDGTAELIFDTFDISETETFTQELNLNIERDGMSLVFGGYYMDDETSRHTHFDNPQPVFGFPVHSGFDFVHLKMNLESTAYFADGTFDLNDKTRLSLGVRRTSDEFTNKQDNSVFMIMPGMGKIIAAQTCLRETTKEYNSTTSRAVLQHDLSESSNVYASISEGFKAGGYATYECADSYAPEEVTSVEFGFKGNISDRTTVNTSVFRYDYSDFQVLQVIGIQTVTRNAGDATVNGVEIEALSQLGDLTTLNYGLVWLDATYGEFENLNGLAPTLGNQQLKGNTLSNAPKLSLNLGINHTRNFESGYTMTYRANASYKSEIYFSEFNDYSQGADTIVDLNVIWENPEETQRTRLYVKNATDSNYVSGYLSAATGGGRFGTWGNPREIGFEITRNF